MKKCEKCEKEFDQKYPEQKFCSRSCSAKVNNSKSQKRYKTKRCKRCDALILSKNTYCPNCIKDGIHLKGGVFLKNKTIKDVLYQVGSNKYGVIRQHAKTVIRDRIQECSNCKYSKHVEICHIKAISCFSLDTTLEIVNHPDNLVLLCPNCHWEFDRHLLKL